MRIYPLLLMLLTWFAIPLYAEEQEISIELRAEFELEPLHLGEIQVLTDNNVLTKNYLTSLQSIFEFDFEHNGRTEIKTLENKDILKQQLERQRFDFNCWQKNNIQYVVAPQITDNRLFAIVLHVRDKIAKRIGTIELSGDLKKDRAEVHRLTDLIFQSLFKKKGIATSKMLYTRHIEAAKQHEIWEIDYDGGNSRLLVREKHPLVTPTYITPSYGMKLNTYMYTSYRTGQPKILVRNLQGGEPFRLNSLRGVQFMPCYNSKLRLVAFVSDVGGAPSIFVQPYSITEKETAKPQQVIAGRKATYASPTWSPDGRKMAYVSDETGSPRIYVCEFGQHFRKNNVKAISKIYRENTCPMWSPDGKWVAYSSRNGKGSYRQIVLYEVETGVETVITTGDEHKENPSWAPNSEHIAYNSVNEGKSDIYFVHIFSLKIAQITKSGGEARFPAWESRVQ